METFDYIIIGLGSAGCILANRLSENPSLNILLIEAGGSDKHPYIQALAGFLKTFDNLRFNWCYQTQEGEGVGVRKMSFREARSSEFPIPSVDIFMCGDSRWILTIGRN